MLGEVGLADRVCSVDDRSREPLPWPVPPPSRREEFAVERRRDGEDRREDRREERRPFR